MEKNITFSNSKGDKLSGVLAVANDDPNTPTVILAHGFTSNKNGSSKEISGLLNKLGINALRFDFYGHGESEGKFEDITLSEGTDDVLQAIKLVKSRGFTKIGLFGTSFGGSCCIMAASKIKDLWLLALRSPVSDYYLKELIQKSKQELNDWKENGYRMYRKADGKELRLNYSFFEDMKNNRGLEAALQINIPTMVVQGDLDTSSLLIFNEMLVKVIPDSELKVIIGGDHRFSNPEHYKEALDMLVEFILKNR
jgi:uncharacterized protein